MINVHGTFINRFLEFILYFGSNYVLSHALSIVYEPQFLGPPVKKRGKRDQRPTKDFAAKPYVFWCEKLKSIEITRWPKDEPHLAKVLLGISERMQPSQWQRVKTLSNIV
jgi:hypothetical protein